MTSHSAPATTPIYLDHNATTPLDPVVLSKIEPYLTTFFANPSSVEHEHGHLASQAVEHARQQVATVIGAQPKEIIFTGSCTEANNLAIIGVARANPDKRHLVTTQIEHPAVLEPMRSLASQGWQVTYLPVDETGRVSPDVVAAAIKADTALVSVMAANNEVGTIQPVKAIGAVCAERGVLFHADLAQALAYNRVDVENDGIHLASLSAHKAYGPKGVGALYVRSRKPRVHIAPILFGGGQERSLRPGTLNTAFIVGMGAALELATQRMSRDSEKLRRFCQRFRDAILTGVSGAQLNGHPTERLPNNLSFSFPGVEPLALIRRLRNHVSFSASSACATDKVQTSHVLLAMFGDTPRARQAFRISPGRFTADEEAENISKLMIDAARELRRMAA